MTSTAGKRVGISFRQTVGGLCDILLFLRYRQWIILAILHDLDLVISLRSLYPHFRISRWLNLL